MARVEVGAGLLAGAVQRQFGQRRHGLGDDRQRRLGLAVQAHQPLHDQLAQDAQRRAGVVPGFGQARQGLFEGRAHRNAVGQQGQVRAIAAVQALEKTRVRSGAGAGVGAVKKGCLHGLRGGLSRM